MKWKQNNIDSIRNISISIVHWIQHLASIISRRCRSIGYKTIILLIALTPVVYTPLCTQILWRILFYYALISVCNLPIPFPLTAKANRNDESIGKYYYDHPSAGRWIIFLLLLSTREVTIVLRPWIIIGIPRISFWVILVPGFFAAQRVPFICSWRHLGLNPAATFIMNNGERERISNQGMT